VELRLKGRIAFITGASRGIGTAIARALASEGVDLGLFGRDIDSCAALTAELRAQCGIRAATVRLDFERPAMIKGAVREAIDALGGVDILVNNAGGAARGSLEELSDEAWDACFAVKPIGLMRMTREALPYLSRSEQGRIINIAGTRGREPSAVSVMAGPINLGTLSATKVLANALGPKGITVNAINPGSTNTQRWDELIDITAKRRNLSREDAEAHLVREVPLGRVVKVEDIADLAVFLASARAGMITGCAINVDGGRTRSI
jgi:NAD(P)-dependent dehydrogenase (short-subunit alcohol dehydrogenase family)